MDKDGRSRGGTGLRDREHGGGARGDAHGTAVPGKRTLVEQEHAPAVQRRGGGDAEPSAVQAAAARGVATVSSPLPHGDRIQRLFGRHDISAVQAHVGREAGTSARAMGAQAYATGNHVVFDGAPSLHTAAHEAAHVVQQRGGVQFAGGVGAAGDRYEQHADAVADLVVAGKSAEALLDEHASATHGAQRAVQMVLVQDSASGDHIETNELTDEEIAALALKFAHHSNWTELQKIQIAHTEQLRTKGYDISNGGLRRDGAAVPLGKHEKPLDDLGERGKALGGEKELGSGKGEKELESGKGEKESGGGKKEQQSGYRKLEIRLGLIHGTHNEATNVIDLHVEQKGADGGLKAADMLAVARHCYFLLLERESQGGPAGQLSLTPQGPAIVKIVVEMLGEALGGTFSKLRAEAYRLRRKHASKSGKSGDKDVEKMDPSVLPEHAAYLDSLTGVGGLEMLPVTTGEYGPKTPEAAEQNMLSSTKAGQERLAQYKSQLADQEHAMGPSIQITLSSAQLPRIIKLLESVAAKSK